MKPGRIKHLLWPLIKTIGDYKMVKLLVILVSIWLTGAVVLWADEGSVNPDFDTLAKALWNIAVYLFSGLDSGVPVTTTGRIVVALILILSLGIVGIFTATIASILVEHRIGEKRKMPKYDLKDHIVICNWNLKGVPLIKELHAEKVKHKRPLVIVSEGTESIRFPEHEDAPEFKDVFMINGDPTNEIILKRANVHQAYTVMVLADPGQGELADAKSILVCMGIKSICQDLGLPKTYIAVEGLSPQNIEHLHRAGADEIISAENFSSLLLAQSSLVHGLSKVYHNLLTITEQTNEVYLVPVPAAFVGKTFSDLGTAMFARRFDDNPVVLVGVKSDGRVMLNPKPADFDVFRKGDEVIVIAFERPDVLVDKKFEGGRGGEG